MKRMYIRIPAPDGGYEFVELDSGKFEVTELTVLWVKSDAQGSEEYIPLTCGNAAPPD